MKKLILFIILFFALNLTIVNNAKAQPQPSVAEENTQPVLPQDDNEVTKKEATQEISSPQFYSEDNTSSFVKGIGVGFAVGMIIGGTLVWFFKKKIS